MLLVAVALLVFREDEPPKPPLDLASGLARLTLVQRHGAPVPGSDGRLHVHIGDITRGQVELTLSHEDGRVLIPTTSVSEGDRLGFAIGGRRYHLAVATLRNRLIGDDTAVLEFFEGRPERDRIEQLLVAMEKSPLTFLRNGSEHDGAAAAAHLRRKWRLAGGRVETAEQFIEHLASRSSTTGRPYEVRLADGRVVGTGTWLEERLAAADRAQPGASRG